MLIITSFQQSSEAEIYVFVFVFVFFLLWYNCNFEYIFCATYDTECTSLATDVRLLVESSDQSIETGWLPACHNRRAVFGLGKIRG